MSLKGLIFGLLLALLSLYFVFRNDGANYAFLPLLLDYAICLICLIVVFCGERVPFSLHSIFHIFCFFFLGIAPAIQLKYNVIFWAKQSRIFINEEYIITSIMFLCSIVIYNILYYLFSFRIKKTFREQSPVHLDERQSLEQKLNVPAILFLTLAATLIFSADRGFNLFAILLRGGLEFVGEKANVKNTSLALIIDMFIRPIPIVTLIYFKLKHKKKKMLLLEIYLLLICLFSNAPTGMPRFQAAASYIPLLIVYSKTIKKPQNFPMAIFGGLLIVFPLLNLFRNVQSLENNQIEIVNFEMFKEGHFDSYQNSMDLLSHNITTGGKQLLGTIFFYVPRSLWPDKPIGSGASMADTLGYSFKNISMNYFAEGFINFGVIGIFIFAVFLAYFNAKYDLLFWEGMLKRESNVTFYLIFIGMEFFILRGDLLSSVAFTIGMYCSTLFVGKFIKTS